MYSKDLSAYKRGTKAGLATGVICGSIICALLFLATGFIPMSLFAVALNSLGLNVVLSEAIGDIIIGPILGLLFAAIYVKLPSKSSITKALILLFVLSIIQETIRVIIFGVPLRHIVLNFPTPLIFGVMLGWFWDRFK